MADSHLNYTSGASAVSLDERNSFGWSREFCIDLAALFNAVIVMLASIAAAWFTDQNHHLIRYAALGLLGGVAVTEAFTQGGYQKFDHLLSPWRTLRGLVWRWWLVGGAMAIGALLTGVDKDFSHNWFGLWIALSALAIIAARFVVADVLNRLLQSGGALNRRVAIVGATDIAQKFIELMKERGKGIILSGIYDDRGPRNEGRDIDGSIDALVKLAMRGGVDEVVICLPWSADSRIDEVFHRLAVLPANIVVCPDLLWLNNVHGHMSQLGGVPVLNIHKRPLEGWGGVLKALEDRLGSALLLLMLSPIMLLTAIAVKLDSPGPVFFRQRRHGFAHEEFLIWKFRTMQAVPETKSVQQAMKDDPRVTFVGRFLRKYSLDELPQLFNVLMGDMSLVGPRPHAIAHNEQYSQVIRDYSGRHKVKPGITGWAQVNGLRGETSEDEMMASRVRYDLFYIEHWSLWFDLRIILMTVRAVLFPKNAW